MLYLFGIQLPEGFAADLDDVAHVLLPTGLNVQIWAEVWDTAEKKTSRWFYDGDSPIEHLLTTDGDDANGLKNERRVGYFRFESVRSRTLDSLEGDAGLVNKVRLQVVDEPRDGSRKAYEWEGTLPDLLKAKASNSARIEASVATKVLVLKEVSFETVRQRYVEALWNVYTRLRSLSLTAPNRSRALAAEASLLLAALEMTRELRQEQVTQTPWLKELVEKVFPFATYEAEDKKKPGTYKRRTASFFHPSKPLLSGKGSPAGAYPTYAAGVTAELNTRSRDVYESVFRGGGDKDEVEYQFVAVGDGVTGTTGLLQRTNEGIGIFLYENAESGKSRNLRKLTFAASEGLRVPTVHIVQFGLEGSDAAKLVFRCGAKTYTLAGKGTWSSADATARVEKVKSASGALVDRTRWADGATFDPRLNDFTFGSSAYAASDGAFTVEIHAAKFSGIDYDEMAVAVIRLPSYAPVGLLGLFGTDECVPRWPDEIPLTETITATEKARGTPTLLADRKELVGVLKSSFESLVSIKDAVKAGTLNSAEVTFVAKGPGNVVTGSLFGELEHISDAAMKSLLVDWKTKPATEMEEYFQQLRASVVELDGARKDGALDVKLTVRSYTDPRASYAHNVTLSEKRCWGLTGLLCRWLLDDGEKDRAKALWTAANGSSATRDAYLKEARKRLSGAETGFKAYDKTVTPLTAFDPKWVA